MFFTIEFFSVLHEVLLFVFGQGCVLSWMKFPVCLPEHLPRVHSVSNVLLEHEFFVIKFEVPPVLGTEGCVCFLCA